MSRKLTVMQTAMLQELVAAKGEMTLPHARGRQDMRTARSLARRYSLTVQRVTKLPGARFSYGYRGVRVACEPATLVAIDAALAHEAAADPRGRPVSRDGHRSQAAYEFDKGVQS